MVLGIVSAAMRVLISNYHPTDLSPQEQAQLAEDLREWPPNDLMVDIRPGHPGGEYPMNGEITLRSFNSVLEFLARHTTDQPEYPVNKDARSGAVRRNPTHTLQIEESDEPIKDASVSVRFDGRYFSIRRPSGNDDENVWNAKAFGLLYHLFQMMVQPVQAPVPAIAIAK